MHKTHWDRFTRKISIANEPHTKSSISLSTPNVTLQERDLSLTGNVYLRFGVIGFMYLSQGLPLGLFGVAIPTYLAEQGVFTKSDIAWYLSFIGLPWAFKFLAGPIMDRFSFLIYGHRRPWVVIAQLGMVLTFTISALTLGWVNITLALLMAVGFTLNLFGSTQDVAVDGMAIGVLKEHERSKATALMFGSQRVGNLIGAGGGGLLLGYFGIPGACAAGALVTFCIVLMPIFSKERSIEKRFPWSEGQIAPEIQAMKIERFIPIAKSLFGALVVPISLFFLAASFCDSVAGGLLGAYLLSFSVQDLGWADDAYNVWFGTINLIAAGFGLVISPLFDRYGQRYCISFLCAVTAIAIVVFLYVPQLQTDWGWRLFMLFFWTAQHLFAILIISSCMQLVTPKIAASQFAIYMSIANLSSTIGNSFIGLIGDIWTFEWILLLTAGLIAVAPFFFWFTQLGLREQTTNETLQKTE